MADLIEHVIEILSSASVGSTSSTGTWRLLGREPIEGTQASSTEGAQIVVTPTGGFKRDRNARLEYPTFQVRVVAPSSGSTGLDLGTDNKLAGIMDALDGFEGELSDGWPYLTIDAASQPLYIGRDGNHRAIYTINFEVIRGDGPDVLFAMAGADMVGNGTFTRATSTSAPATYALATPAESYGTVTTANSGQARIEWVST